MLKTVVTADMLNGVLNEVVGLLPVCKEKSRNKME